MINLKITGQEEFEAAGNFMNETTMEVTKEIQKRIRNLRSTVNSYCKENGNDTWITGRMYSEMLQLKVMLDETMQQLANAEAYRCKHVGIQFESFNA